MSGKNKYISTDEDSLNLKIDNMKHQHKSIIDGSNEQTYGK